MPSSSAPLPRVDAAPRGRSAPAQTLASALEGPDNALNLIRLVLALLVLVSHTGAVAGGTEWPSFLTGLGSWAVHGFFAISGYLIVGSRLRSRPLPFIVRRLVRIYPAYWMQLLVVAFLLAPAGARLSTGTWTVGAGVDYVRQNLSLFDLTWTVDGIVFPYYGAWNGSMWTLMYELLAYLACFLLFSIPWARRHLLAVTAVGALGSTLFHLLARDVLDVTTNLYLHGGRQASYFLMGALLYALRDRLPVHWWLLGIGATLTTALHVLPGGDAVSQLPFAYTVLSAGALLPGRLGTVNDLSYGVYVYAFPLQQMASFLHVERWGLLTHLVVSSLATLVAAAASWFLVEKPTMGLARRLLGRSAERRTAPPRPRGTLGRHRERTR